MKEKNFRMAVRAYENALKENPDLPAQTKLNLGHAYYELGKNRQAQKNYIAALTNLQSPSLKSNACLQLGNLFVKEKNYKTALEWYQKSLLNQADNKKARINYELAWNLNKRKEEEEKKKNSAGNPEQDKKQNQENNNANQTKKDSGKPQPGRDQKGRDGESEKEENQKNSNKGKEQSSSNQEKENEKDKEEPKGKNEGKQTEENEDDGGKESKKKTKESNSDDPESYRLDRQKLRESGLNEEQAKNMLKAMRQSEVKYLQQRRFQGNNKPTGKTGPRW